MATQSAPQAASTTASTTHPLTPLSSVEIVSAAGIIRSLYPANTSLLFKAVTLQEPEKAATLKYLDAEHAGTALPTGIDRKAFIAYYIRNTDKFHEAVVNLTSRTVEYNKLLGANKHGPGDAAEILVVEKVALGHEDVLAAIKELNLPEGAVVCADPWIYGSDGINDDKRMFQVFLYMRDPKNSSEADSNHYAFPLPISPVIDAENASLVRIDRLPTGLDNKITNLEGPYPVRPANEYIPEAQTLRTDLKPLNVVQPEGASFKVTSAGENASVIEWQKWYFRIGFNQREGMVMYDVRYDGRPLFYRVSLSDMNIPYADPRQPYARKSAFDLGDVGAGHMANNLQLGCDCLGSIHYLSSVLADDTGAPIDMPNVVCIHEQDNGIGWKHTNYRTGRAAVTRNRELVLQSIITVSNYEYIMAFMLNQAGEFAYEVRATGILSTQPIDEGVDVPWGTVVHPGVLAAHHQHIFSLRIDPNIEGSQNRLVYDEAHAMPIDDFNPLGTGYMVTETPITTSSGLDLNSDTNRLFKIQSSTVRNPINHKPVAYKIMAPNFQKMLAHPTSFHHKRAEFADHNIYVTKYAPNELYAGGTYTNQSRGGDGVRTWADRKDNVLDEDIVVWVQFGINHVPRIEDFPVMPCEIIKVHLKPVNFFDKNPALDVPPSKQAFNQSTLLSEQHHQGAGVETKIGEQGAPCCAPKL